MMHVATACRSLARAGLVVATQGNASRRADDRMLIKPSGVACSAMNSERMVAMVDLKTGERVGPVWHPSTDAPTHRWLYNNMPPVEGIVHTHSPWATAWAVAGIPIPCCSTAQADVFGGDIPCGAYCPIGGEDIGKEILRLYEQDTRRRAFLIRQHGVFVMAEDLRKAVEYAVLVEHFAHVTLMASRLAGLKLVPQAEIDANYMRYHASYGQPV